MLTGLSGSLISHQFAANLLHVEFAGRLGEPTAAAAHQSIARWWQSASARVGPASGVRTIWDTASVPLAERLGFVVGLPIGDREDTRHAVLTGTGTRVLLFAATWSVPLDRVWRQAVRSGIGLSAPWALCTNGREWRLVDTERTYSRAYLQFDLRQTFECPATFRVVWSVVREEAFRAAGGDPPLITQVIRSSARHGLAVGRSLRFGVVEAVQHLLCALNRCGRHELSHLLDESLTVVYRLLFLMFAESRGLVPNWHPLYRDSYTIESLREQAERRDAARGLWAALQAIARLAYKGCRAGSLVVAPFNGRLFSPARSPIVESCDVDDESARRALLAVSASRPGTRFDYRDLGVEQLGAVYESLLDYEPAFADARRDRIVFQKGGDARKSTGSFYTPQAITDYVVRRTLSPLVDGATSDEILALRVIDPAMGSAAFLVAACHYLARAYERAIVSEGRAHEGDLSDADRADFRRLVAQRCLYGVDLNPTAVHLARLSLWLATLSAGKPLTFLDHRLACGNSLRGASPADVVRQPPGARRRQRPADTPLFPDGVESSIARAVSERQWLAETRDETAEVVREKERRLDRLRAGAPWRSIVDLWCACWMWQDAVRAPDPAVFALLVDKIRRGRCQLPEHVATLLLDEAARTTRTHRFFHWTFEFPEIYYDIAGQPLPNPGFDAVLGNPPWDMLRAGGAEKTFLRCSGVYRHQGAGHINRYQIFAERALSLTRRDGRIGLVLPSGFATDHTSAPLRRELLTHASIDTISGFDNRKAIFPIHRSVRFLVCTATKGPRTDRIACRFGIDDASELETIPDSGDRPHVPAHPVTLTPSFLAALDDRKLAIPELRTTTDLRILERIVHEIPRLDAADGWHVKFGRELNATDDRMHFHTGRGGLPVVEGKHIEPFAAHVDRSALRIPAQAARRLLDADATFSRSRLAYRDVASSTNRLSLIAAMIPPGVVTTHSLFCLKTPLAEEDQAFLCAMLNSFVANYLVRQMVTTHLGSATVESLRVPKPDRHSPVRANLARLSAELNVAHAPDCYARLQALAAACYGLTVEDFAHVLDTFPLIDAAERAAALNELRSDRFLK